MNSIMRVGSEVSPARGICKIILRPIGAQSGVSLVELMIAVTIGLLATIVIFTVYKNADGYKRTTVGVGDAQSNGAIALFTLERYIRTSGSSLVTTNEVQPGGFTATKANLLLGCALSGFPNANVISGPAGAPTTPIAPVRIVDGSLLTGGIASTSDAIVIMAGNADIATNPTRAAPIAGGSLSLVGVQNLYGWRIGGAGRPSDIALLTIDRPSGGSTSAIPCAARRIAAVSVTSGSGAITLAGATPAIGYVPRSSLHNLGPSPFFLTLSINAQQELVETNFARVATGESAIPEVRIVADGIVSLQAQYGIDDNQDDVIDRWVEPVGVWGNPVLVDVPGTVSGSGVAAITKIKAIRIAVLARSAHYAAPDRDTNACVATATVPNWRLLAAVAGIGTLPAPAALALPAGVDILPLVVSSAPSNAANADWRCFKYRTFENIIPVLNMLRSPL